MQIIKVFLREITSYVSGESMLLTLCNNWWIAQISVLSLKGAWGVFWNIIHDPSDLKCSCDSEAQVWEYFDWKAQTLESLFEFHPLEQRRAICIGNQLKEFYKFIWCLKLSEIRNGSQPTEYDIHGGGGSANHKPRTTNHKPVTL